MQRFSGRKILGIGFIAAVFVVAAVVWKFWDGGNFIIGADNREYAQIVKIEEPEITVSGEKWQMRSPLRVVFSNNIAAADLIDGTLTGKGIEVSPALKGKWQFKKASVLTFTPESDWLPGRRYEVFLKRNILAPGVELREQKFIFSSPKFSGKQVKSSFYEDPRNRRDKAVTAEFEFNFPLRDESVRSAVRVTSADGETYGFRYKLADGGHRLYVVSDPIEIKREADFVTVTVAGAVNRIDGGVLDRPTEVKIKIPGVADFFNVKSVTTAIERDKQNDDRPEQILRVTFTAPAEAGKVVEYLKLFYSDDTCAVLREKAAAAGNDPNKIKNLKPLSLRPLEQENPGSTSYRFSYRLTERNKCLMAVVQKGLSSEDGFTLSADAVQFMEEADYPPEARVAYQGAVIPLKKNPMLQFAARGVKELQVRLARIESDDLNNLVTQTRGRFASPYFANYNFNEYNMAQVFEKNIPLNAEDPAALNYASLDLRPYLGENKGIFIVLLKGKADENSFSAEDRRLIVVTDLGLVVKDNLDRTHDVFVSSLNREAPVAGAGVEVLGRNGLSVVSVKTDASGHAKIPDLSGFEDEKQPVAYKVSLNGDVSYLPFDRYDLRVNYSRFSVGGVYMPDDDPDGLNAYVFSDRGLYRPGEKVHLGIVLRQNDLDVPAHLPLEIEVMNPRGDTAAEGRLTVLSDGLTEYTYDIPEGAATGYYNLTLYRKNEKQERVYVASGYFRVEEFEADTMKLDLKFGDNVSEGWINAKEVSVEAFLANLYGNPAIGHEVKGSYTLYPSGFYFQKYTGYTFADPLKKKDAPVPETQKGTLPTIKTGENGKATFTINLARYLQGTYRLVVNADGMEAGSGRGVSTEISGFVSPHDYLIGYKADGTLTNIAKDSSCSVNLIAVDNNLEQIAKDNLVLRLKKRNRVSSLVEMPNGTFAYQISEQEELIREQALEISSAGRRLELDTSSAGEFILYILEEEKVVGKVEYAVSAAVAPVSMINKNAGLAVKLNKDEYAPGEMIEAEISAPYEGYGLVTIERDGVYAYKWFKADGTNAKVSLRLPAGVEGNAYLNAAWFRSLKSDEIFMSPLSYAVVPFAINKAARTIDVTLQVPEKVRPGDRLVIGYRTSVPAQIIVWGVNEGILQAADYETPNPLNFFMNKKALRVITAQIMDMIMPEANIVRFLKAPGGGAGMERKMLRAMAADAAANRNPFARKIDKAAAFWSGILNADKTERQFVYEVPETFSGQFRIMAAAVNPKQFGGAEKNVLVRGDFAIVPSGPFNAAPGDEFSIGVGLTNLVEGSGSDYKIKLKAQPSAGLELIGETEHTVILPEGGEKTLIFRAKALDILGPAEIRFSAEAVDDSGRKAEMPYYMGIRPAVPYMTDLQMGYRKDKLEMKDFLLKLYPQYRIQELSASASPLVLAGGLLKYLDKFEHDCTEQVVSRAFPAVELMFKHPELVDSDEVYRKFNEAVRTLTERQKINGGFGIWNSPELPENREVSLYAADFLTAADRHGMNVPHNLLDRVLGFVRSVAAASPENADDSGPAYAAYILTRYGEITTNYLLNLEQELAVSDAQNWKSTLSAAYLAAGYRLLGNEAKAAAVMGTYRKSDNVLNNVRYARLVAEVFPERFADKIRENTELVLHPLETGFYNTWTAAYSILAMNGFAGKTAGKDEDIVFEGAKADYRPFASVDPLPGTERLTVISPNPFFYVLRQQGYREGLVDKSESSGMEVSKTLLNKEGEPIKQLKPGDEIEAVIKLRSLTGKDIYDVAVVDLLPGGADIVINSISSDSFLDFSESREDRMLAYLTVKPQGNVIRYKATVVSRGSFIVPPVYASAMYDITVRAHGVSGRMTVE